MKKASGIILLILGSAISVFGFMVAIRMLLNFSPVILSLRAGDPSGLLAFLFYVIVCVGGGIALIIIGERLRRNV